MAILVLKFCRSPYLDNHSLESIDTWAIDTRPVGSAFIPWHRIPGSMPGGEARGSKLEYH